MARLVINVVSGQVESFPDLPAEEKVVQVPYRVQMRQARHALLGAGLLSQVEAAIEAFPEPAKSTAKIEWEYSTTLDRDNPVVLQLIPLLGLTEQQVDQLFITAASL